ncbi:MAG TPA: tetratricopeptide repeat protein [Reyranella sp.]|nr:tetratricopeptide repeat protein [Reyranella sp.]
MNGPPPAGEPISSEAGQALIRLAAEAAAAGDFDKAIAAQRQAAEMAGHLFGDDSLQKATANVNLGSLYLRAQRPGDAFDSYRDGLERLFAQGMASDAHGGALENLLESGLQAGRPRETGQALLTLAKHAKAWPGAINLAKLAAMAFVTAELLPPALDAFEVALACQASLDPAEARKWATPIMGMAAGLAQSLKEPERTELAALVTRFAATATKGGWSDAVLGTPRWAELMADLALPQESGAATPPAAERDTKGGFLRRLFGSR